MTTGIIVGEGIRGTINEYLTNRFDKTGRAGKRTSIGRSNKLGVCKVCNPERDHNNRLERCNHVSPDHNQERSNQSGHNHNTGRQVHNPERRLNHNTRRQVHNPERANHSTHSNNRETMKERKERNRIEGRNIICSSDGGRGGFGVPVHASKLIKDVDGVKSVKNRMTIE